ncbi:MAG: DNA-processing protein DprA [Fimbriiglobus sp.]
MADLTPPPDSLRPHLALALTPGLGPKLTRAVLEHFGSPEAVLRATNNQLQAVPLIGQVLASRFVQSFAKSDEAIDAEWQLIQAHKVSVSVWGTPEYPARLTTIEDPPMLVYSLGKWAKTDGNAIGIVGSRSCSSYGKRMAFQIANQLAQAGWTIVSGLARGIDGEAHKGTLAANGRTIAVLGGGLANIYPPEHKDLAAEIGERGLLLTETPMNVGIQPGMFPARNRIISALTRAVVVIEANIESGALITARHAAEQGREVFVIPGNVDSKHSEGSLELIRKGARLVRSAADILEDIQGLSPPDPPPTRTKTKPTLFDAVDAPPPPKAKEMPTGLDDVQKALWEALTQPRHADELAREMNLPAAQLSVQLMKLEMRRVLRRLPGNIYERA